MSDRIISQYFRQEMLPHIWCAGCGNGTLTRDIATAIHQLKLDQDKVVVVSGIGCSSRAAGYLDFNTIHTTHGRAIPVATGIKMARPELTVLVITGDGDATAIGGNHFIHGARRNIDLTVIVMNNNIYGMTGGQYSPTTPTGAYGTTAPYGNIDMPFDVVKLAVSAGASFAGRGDVYHTRKTTEVIRRGIAHRGFAVIDCVSTCPTYYGRKNKKGTAAQMVLWQKEHMVPMDTDRPDGPRPQGDKIPVGVLYEDQREEYTDLYEKIIQRAAEVREHG